MIVPSGDLACHRIRRARKAHPCDGWGYQRGHATIQPGDWYVETEWSERAGGYAMARACLACVPAAAAVILPPAGMVSAG